jgi:3-oxoadipate enol-lactonase
LGCRSLSAARFLVQRVPVGVSAGIRIAAPRLSCVGVFIAESGLAPGRVALFLHPLGLDHTIWEPQQEALGDELRLLMPDLPGFGRSRLEECGLRLSVEACAEALGSGSGPAVVIGVSYGGWVAALLAANYPDLVAGLAISGVRARIPRSLVALQAGAFRAMPVGQLKRGEPVSNDVLKIEKRHLIEASRELGEIDLMSSLPLITAPTVVFAPSRDWFVRREAPHVAAAIPGARLTPVPGAGHLWTQRQPAPLIECVRALASAAEIQAQQPS